MDTYKNYPVYYAEDSLSWRKWLEDHGENTSSVFLLIYKKNCGVPSITYDEAVNVALCFGWVDSKINKRDEISWYQYFAKRNPKSNWSRINKLKVEQLIANGLMSKNGLEMVRLAKELGTWSALDDVENLIMPEEMKTMMNHNTAALQNWEKFPRSVKRGILEWIYNAKKMETKMERIEKTVLLAAENKRANY
ncbi:MAG: YdeI/OmpD-associated family protein [Saprospiraceae bacterium]|nr:YdeI/OmpD-associated family protein [Saprospiraceae bacterium]